MNPGLRTLVVVPLNCCSLGALAKNWAFLGTQVKGETKLLIWCTEGLWDVCIRNDQGLSRFAGRLESRHFLKEHLIHYLSPAKASGYLFHERNSPAIRELPVD